MSVPYDGADLTQEERAQMVRAMVKAMASQLWEAEMNVVANRHNPPEVRREVAARRDSLAQALAAVKAAYTDLLADADAETSGAREPDPEATVAGARANGHATVLPAAEVGE